MAPTLSNAEALFFRSEVEQPWNIPINSDHNLKAYVFLNIGLLAALPHMTFFFLKSHQWDNQGIGYRGNHCAEGHVRAAEKASGLQTRSSTMEGDQVQVWLEMTGDDLISIGTSQTHNGGID